MAVVFYNCSKEWTAGRQNHFVSLDLLITTGNSNIKEVLVFSHFLEGCAYVLLKVIPPQTEFHRFPHYRLLCIC